MQFPELWSTAEAFEARGDVVGAFSTYLALAEKGDRSIFERIAAYYQTSSQHNDVNPHQIWFRRAALERNTAYIHLYLGHLYYLGVGCERDYQRAHCHLVEASESGLPEACIILGEIYFFGAGREKDFALARKYFEFAAACGYFIAYRYLLRIELIEKHGSSAEFVGMTSYISPSCVGLTGLELSPSGALPQTPHSP